MSVWGGESKGIFHFEQGGRAGPLCSFLSMYSPRAHPGPPSPMDSEILIKPLSLWPEYSTGGRADFSIKRETPGDLAPGRCYTPYGVNLG